MSRNSNGSHREKIFAVLGGVTLVTLSIFSFLHAAYSAETTATTPTATTPSVEELANQQRHADDQLNYAKNLRREIEDIKREVKTGIDTSKAEGLVGQFETCINNNKTFIGTPDFWTKMQDCYDFNRDLDVELQDNLRPQRDCQNIRRGIDDRKREKKNNVDRTIKDILRGDKNADVSELNKLISLMDQAFAKAEPLLTGTCTPETLDALRGISDDLNFYFQDWYTASQDLNEKVNQARRLTDNTRDFEKNLKRQCEKDIARQLKQSRDGVARLEKAGTLTDDLKHALGDLEKVYNDMCVVQIGAMQQAIQSGDMDAFDDARNEFHNLNRDFWDIQNEAGNIINSRQQLKDVMRDISRQEKELSRMQKEYERIVKKTGEQPDVKQIVDDFAAMLARAKEAAQADPQSYWNDYNQDLNELQNTFWNSQQKVQSLKDVERWLRDIEKEVQFRVKDLKNMKKERGVDQGLITELQGLLDQMNTLVSQARETAKTDPDAARDTLQSMDDLRFQWDETSRSLWEGKEIVFEVGKIKNEIVRMRPVIAEMVRSRKISKEVANTCLNFLKDAEAKIDEATQTMRRDELGDFLDELELQGMEACAFMDEMGPPPPPDYDYYREFIVQNVRGVDTDIAASVLEKVSEDIVGRVIQRLLSNPTVVQNLLQTAGEQYKDIAAGTLEAATSFYDESAQQEVIAKKTEILELTKKLEALQEQIQIAQDKLRELEAIRNEIANYNFYGDAGDTIRADIEAFIAEAQSRGLTKEEVRERVEELRTKKDRAIENSRRAKFEANIIPFLDTDDNFWGTKFVAPLAKFGIVAGKGEGRFDPGADVTVAEIITMAFRASGDQEVDGDSTLCNGKYRDHWANRFIRWAEATGLSVVASCSDLNRPALRWEVTQVLLETAIDGPIESTDEQCFSDVKPSDEVVNSAVCKARNEGIMSGIDGKANAYNKVNRAEAATMVKQTAEKLFGFSFKVSSRDSSDNDFEDFEEEFEEDEEDFDEFEEEEE